MTFSGLTEAANDLVTDLRRVSEKDTLLNREQARQSMAALRELLDAAQRLYLS